ncbi:sulfotransferase family protein [Arenibaculum pallidiluteum]|uniref:sulfotransferase family protein n=1 Tax=Arenibaculum pallidiluteum TaxID=2812559 RepID=UPI001A95B783|nr:sulfotransferase [Arenibaculum pallidiluteum]
MKTPFRPVFVVGCQRSGSTLLGAMLGSHPDVVCIPEAQFLAELMPPSPRNQEIAPRPLIDAVERHWRFRAWEWALDGRRPGPGDCPATYRGAMEWLVRQYDRDTKGGHSSVWVEQQPGHVRHLQRLFQHFPDARAIHIIRDGRAVAASLMPLDWGPNEILPAANFWEQRVARGFAAGAFLGSERLIHVHYEDLVREPEQTMRRIAGFVGIPFDDAMTESGGLRVPRFTRSQHRLVGALPDPARIDAWKRRLTSREIEIFEAVSGDLLGYLGYEPMLGNPRPPSYLEKLGQLARDQARKGLNWARFHRRTRPYRVAGARPAATPEPAPPKPLAGTVEAGE